MKIRNPFLTGPGESILTSSFVKRRKEIKFLSDAFFRENKRVICLHGLRGIGKTTLAAEFADINGHKLPGGVAVIRAQFPSDIHASLAKINKNKPSLIIWDDIDFLPDSSIFQNIENVINNFPGAYNILISSYRLEHKIIDSTLLLPSLSHAEMYQLFKSRLEGYTEIDFEEFWKLFLGHPLASELAFSSIRNGTYTANEIIHSLKSFSESGLLGPDGRPLTEENYKSIITDISSVNEDLLRRLDRDPTLFFRLPSRKFEEVVAELLNKMGYEITLTPATRDGGKDIYAAKKDSLGTFLYIVECKKYGPDNHVGVGLIRELYGVVQAENATAGILATTSFFSKPAKEFQEKIKYQVSLRDYIDIQKWLKSIINV